MYICSWRVERVVLTGTTYLGRLRVRLAFIECRGRSFHKWHFIDQHVAYVAKYLGVRRVVDAYEKSDNIRIEG